MNRYFSRVRELFRGRTGRKAIVLLTTARQRTRPHLDASSAQPREGVCWLRGSLLMMWRANSARTAFALFIVSTENRPRAMTRGGPGRAAPD